MVTVDPITGEMTTTKTETTPPVDDEVARLKAELKRAREDAAALRTRLKERQEAANVRVVDLVNTLLAMQPTVAEMPQARERVATYIEVILHEHLSKEAAQAQADAVRDLQREVVAALRRGRDIPQ